MSEYEKKGTSSAGDTSPGTSHIEKRDGIIPDADGVDRSHLNAMFQNPLADISEEQLRKDVDEFVEKWGLTEFRETFYKGALVAQSPRGAQNLEILTQEDKLVLEREHTHKWHQPFALYWLVGTFLDL